MYLLYERKFIQKKWHMATKPQKEIVTYLVNATSKFYRNVEMTIIPETGHHPSLAGNILRN
jgi:hypothetical protein